MSVKMTTKLLSVDVGMTSQENPLLRAQIEEIEKEIERREEIRRRFCDRCREARLQWLQEGGFGPEAQELALAATDDKTAQEAHAAAGAHARRCRGAYRSDEVEAAAEASRRAEAAEQEDIRMYVRTPEFAKGNF